MNLRLISLYCSATEDSTGADEPYLHVNGIKVWGSESPGLNDQETVDLSAVPVTASTRRTPAATPL